MVSGQPCTVLPHCRSRTSNRKSPALPSTSTRKPGLGARITEPEWQAKWAGIIPYDDNGAPQVDLVKVRNPSAKNQVDAIAGATLTSNGVEHLMNFWLGEQGYKPLVDHIRNGEISLADLREASQAAIGQNGQKTEQ